MALSVVHRGEYTNLVIPRLTKIVNVLSVIILVFTFFIPLEIGLLMLLPFILAHALIFRVHFKNKASIKTLALTTLFVVSGSIQILALLQPLI